MNINNCSDDVVVGYCKKVYHTMAEISDTCS